MKLALVVSAIGFATVASAQFDATKEMIFTETKAFALLPPIVVGKAKTETVKWSADGKFLLVVSSEEKITLSDVTSMFTKAKIPMPGSGPEVVISMFNVEKQLLTQVWRGKAEQAAFMDADWLPGNSTLVLSMSVVSPNQQTGEREDRQALYLVSASSGKITTLLQTAASEFGEVITQANSKSAILRITKWNSEEGTNKMVTRYLPLSSDGRLGTGIVANGREGRGEVMWVNGGTRPVMMTTTRRDGANKPSLIWFALDFASSSLKSIEPQKLPIDTGEEETDRPTAISSIEGAMAKRVQVAPDSFYADFGSTQSRSTETAVSLKSIWLTANEKGPHQSAIIAAEADLVSLSPAKNAVFYTTKGIGMVRPLISLPKELALKALEAAEKTKLVSEAKQVALAFLMYAADMDDNLKGGDWDWAGDLGPYTKNQSLMDGFVYTFKGGNMADVDDPSGTVLGYKQGPGGKAVAYVDGHVKWIPDP